MDRRQFLVSLLGAAGLGAVSARSRAITPATSVPPNVVVFYTDDQNRDHFGFTGGNVLTPNVDRLAREGLSLERFYISSPVCTPSRFSTLTGQYA